MSQIRSKDTKPELTVRKYLFSKGFRYRLHDKKLPGRPDIVLPRFNVVIFVHGCFWHGHVGCKYYVVPKTRTDWWVKKINRNRTLDQKHRRELKKRGLNVISIFECQLKTKNLNNALTRLLKSIVNI